MGLHKCLETSYPTLKHLTKSEIVGIFPMSINQQGENMSQERFETKWEGWHLLLLTTQARPN